MRISRVNRSGKFVVRLSTGNSIVGFHRTATFTVESISMRVINTLATGVTRRDRAPISHSELEIAYLRGT